MTKTMVRTDEAGGPAGTGAMAIARMETGRLAELIGANLGDGGLTAQDLDRIKVPAGGGTSWTIPGIEGETEAKEVIGVIVLWRARKAYWQQSMEDSGGGTPPDCASDDGLIGVGAPGGPCRGCSFNSFGSAKGGAGAGKACKDVIQLFMVRGDELLPTVVSVPASSISNVRSYFRGLATRGIIYYGAVTALALSRTKNGGGIVYSEIVPRMERQLTDDEIVRVRAYSEAIAACADAVRVERTEGDPFAS